MKLFVSLILCLIFVFNSAAVAGPNDGPNQGGGRYWGSEYHDDWFYDQPQTHRARRRRLICSVQSQTVFGGALYMAVEISLRPVDGFQQQDQIYTRVVANNFRSIDECRRSINNDRPGFICASNPPNVFSGIGKFYIKRKSSNQGIQGIYRNQQDCISALTNARRRKICSPLNYNRFGLKDLVTGEFLNQSPQFRSIEDCNSSLQNTRRGLACFPSRRRLNKFYAYDLRQGKAANGYYKNEQDCLESIRRNRRRKICMESSRRLGKAFILNLNNDQKESTYFNSLQECHSSIDNMRNGVLCLRSNRRLGKFYPHNFIQNAPIGDYQYFNSIESCYNSSRASAFGYMCMPSARYRGQYYIHSYDGQRHLDGYFENQQACTDVMGPYVEAEREQRCFGRQSRLPPLSRVGRNGRGRRSSAQQTVGSLYQILQHAQQ